MGGNLDARSTSLAGAAARPSMCRCRWTRAGGSWCRSGSPIRWRIRCGGSRRRSRANDLRLRQLLDRRRAREQVRPLHLRPEARLQLPDEALELADPLPEGGVLGVEPGDRGGGLVGPCLPPAGDAAPGRADALRSAARRGPAADRAQTGLWRRTYVTRRDVGLRAMRGETLTEDVGAGGPARRPRVHPDSSGRA
jgi:hypothetical protein